MGLRLISAILAIAAIAGACEAGPPRLPAYTASGLVNAASGEAGAVAANTILSLYGEGLAFVTRALRASDIAGNRLPTVLPGSGVRVLIAGVSAGIYFVSPRQVNLLVPSDIAAGATCLQLVRDGINGPQIPVTIRPAAPALFLGEAGYAIATTAEGGLVASASPASADQTIVLYATGLGAVAPPLRPAEIPRAAAWLVRREQFHVRLDGTRVEQERILYVGASPGFAGLYQINITLPPIGRPDPQIRIELGDEISPEGVKLPAR